MIQLTNRSFRRELRRSLRGCRPRFSLGLDLFEEGYCLDFFGFLIPLLFLDRWRREPHEIMETWGFTYVDRSLHLRWGRHCKILWMPWLKEGVENEVRREDGSWRKKAYSYEDTEPDGRKLESFPYRYTLRNGQVQEVTATVYASRIRYVWRLFRKRPLFWSLWAWRYWIDVEFSGEVGERAGSWKGGVIGCSYEMKPGETPLETLQRMEQERKF